MKPKKKVRSKAKLVKTEVVAAKKPMTHYPIALGFSALAAMTVISACSVDRAPHSDPAVNRLMCRSALALNINEVQTSRMQKAADQDLVIHTAIVKDENNIIASKGLKTFTRETVQENAISGNQISVQPNCDTLKATIFAPTLENGSIKDVDIKETDVNSMTFESIKDGYKSVYVVRISDNTNTIEMAAMPEDKGERRKLKASIKESAKSYLNTIRFSETRLALGANSQAGIIPTETLVISQMISSKLADDANYEFSSNLVGGSTIQSDISVVSAQQKLSKAVGTVWMTAAELLGITNKKGIDVVNKAEPIEIKVLSDEDLRVQLEKQMAEVKIEIPTIDINQIAVNDPAVQQALEDKDLAGDEVSANEDNVIVVTGKRYSAEEKAAYNKGKADGMSSTGVSGGERLAGLPATKGMSDLEKASYDEGFVHGQEDALKEAIKKSSQPDIRNIRIIE